VGQRCLEHFYAGLANLDENHCYAPAVLSHILGMDGTLGVEPLGHASVVQLFEKA
jgi:hypothetical protein